MYSPLVPGVRGAECRVPPVKTLLYERRVTAVTVPCLRLEKKSGAPPRAPERPPQREEGEEGKKRRGKRGVRALRPPPKRRLAHAVPPRRIPTFHPTNPAFARRRAAELPGANYPPPIRCPSRPVREGRPEVAVLRAAASAPRAPESPPESTGQGRPMRPPGAPAPWSDPLRRSPARGAADGGRVLGLPLQKKLVGAG